MQTRVDGHAAGQAHGDDGRPAGADGADGQSGRADERGVRASLTVGAPLIAGVPVTGFTATSAAWPLASYPAFAGIRAPTITGLSLEVVDADGERTLTPSPGLRDLVTWEKYDGLVRPILRAGDDPPVDRVAGLLEVRQEQGVSFPADGELTLLRDGEESTRDGGEVVDRRELASPLGEPLRP